MDCGVFVALRAFTVLNCVIDKDVNEWLNVDKRQSMENRKWLADVVTDNKTSSSVSTENSEFCPKSLSFIPWRSLNNE